MRGPASTSLDAAGPATGGRSCPLFESNQIAKLNQMQRIFAEDQAAVSARRDRPRRALNVFNSTGNWNSGALGTLFTM